MVLLPCTRLFFKFPDLCIKEKETEGQRSLVWLTRISCWITAYFLEEASFRHSRKSLGTGDLLSSSLLACCVTLGERFTFSEPSVRDLSLTCVLGIPLAPVCL